MKKNALPKEMMAQMVEHLTAQISSYCRSSPTAIAAMEPRARLCHLLRYVNNAVALVAQLEKIMALAQTVKGLRGARIKRLEREIFELRCLVAEWRQRCQEMN